MALSIARISLGSVDTERAIRDALDTLGVPLGEEWLASVATRAAGAAWDVVLEGPCRSKADHIDWEIVEHDNGARYRKLFHGKNEQCAEHLKRSVRKLLWECIQFRENPIRTISPQLAEAFEEAVWRVLRNDDLRPVRVRFGVWREGFDGMRFVCKVEYSVVPGAARQLPWSWWSSLVRTPEDLALELHRALTMRRKRRVSSPAALARARRRAAARAAARAALAAAPPAPAPPAVEAQPVA